MTEPTDVTEVAEVEEVIETPEGVEVIDEVESAPADEAPVREPILIDRPIQTVGRRKEAVVRVRLTPGEPLRRDTRQISACCTAAPCGPS